MNYIDKDNGPVKFIPRSERRKMLRNVVKQGAVKNPTTLSEKCEKIKVAIKYGKKISGALQDNWDINEMNKQAEKNSETLKHFIDTFGEEKGREIYNKNLELKENMKKNNNNNN